MDMGQCGRGRGDQRHFSRACVGRENQPGQPLAAHKMQKDGDPPPGAENMNKKAERMQNATPTDDSQRQKPAGKSSSD